MSIRTIIPSSKKVVERGSALALVVEQHQTGCYLGRKSSEKLESAVKSHTR